MGYLDPYGIYPYGIYDDAKGTVLKFALEQYVKECNEEEACNFKPAVVTVLKRDSDFEYEQQIINDPVACYEYARKLRNR